jgi:hypothetical protein
MSLAAKIPAAVVSQLRRNIPAALARSPLWEHSGSSLQILSDVHMEFRTGEQVPVVAKYADNIALLGDIGKPYMDSYEKFIAEQSRNFKNVLLLLGNHEYYHGSRGSQEIKSKVACILRKYGNVHLLDRGSFELTEKTTVLGCTLWSNIEEHACPLINDFKMIHVPLNGKKKGSFSGKEGGSFGYQGTFSKTRVEKDLLELLTRKKYLEWHKRDLSWLEGEIEKLGKEGKDVLVLTHHGPHPVMLGKYEYDPARSAFVSDLSHLFAQPVVAFASGHVHSNCDEFVNGIRTVSNAFGYKNEDLSYRDDVIITVQ